MPSPPAFETAAASSGTADIGAWTIGCSMPSSSQTGVHRYHPLPGSGLQHVHPASTWTRLISGGESSSRYDS